MEPRRKQCWLWVTHLRFAQDENDPNRDRPDLGPGSTVDYWTCHKDHRAGELALLYVTAPFSEVRWLLRAEFDARSVERDAAAQREGWTHGCAYIVLERFEKPVTFQELRQDQQLARWDAISRNLEGELGAWAVPPRHWERLRRRWSAAILKQARASTDRAARGSPWALPCPT